MGLADGVWKESRIQRIGVTRADIHAVGSKHFNATRQICRRGDRRSARLNERDDDFARRHAGQKDPLRAVSDLDARL
jgi:hypothetical protein